MLYGLVALQSAGFAINNPARTAIIPRLVEPRLLPAANVLQTVAWNVALTVGPLLAAFLVAGPGFAAAYAVDAVLFTAALWALWRLPGLPPIVGPDDKPLRLGLSAVVDGFRYLGTRPNVRMTFVVDLIAMIMAMPRVLFPAVGVLFLGGGAFTTGCSARRTPRVRCSPGCSPVAWSGWCTRVGSSSPRSPAFGLAVAGFGAVLLGTGAGRPPAVLWVPLVAAGVFLALAGGADSVSSVFRQTILQSATPDDMRGRLQGIFIVVVAGGPRLGDLVLGTAATWTAESWAALGGGLLCVVLVVAVAAGQPRILGLRRPSSRP